MDRLLTNDEKRRKFSFDQLDLFPYALALLMICAEIYILHQFVALTPVHY